LLSGSEDTDITDFFIDTAFPSPNDVREIIVALEDNPDGLSEPQLLAAVNIRRSRLNQALKMLAIESPAPIVRKGSQWQLTASRLNNSFWERAERLTDLRHKEQAQMQEYLALESGHMEFLVRALDGSIQDIQQPDLLPLSADIIQENILKAVEFLKRASLKIEPRKQWPNRQWIPYQERTEEGRALCAWGDAGWGNMIRTGKYMRNLFSDELIDASVELIREWKPQPSPAWVTCIPSHRHPHAGSKFCKASGKQFRLAFQGSPTQNRCPPGTKGYGQQLPAGEQCARLS